MLLVILVCGNGCTYFDLGLIATNRCIDQLIDILVRHGTCKVKRDKMKRIE